MARVRKLWEERLEAKRGRILTCIAAGQKWLAAWFDFSSHLFLMPLEGGAATQVQIPGFENRDGDVQAGHPG